jgi:hypothetical protein
MFLDLYEYFCFLPLSSLGLCEKPADLIIVWLQWPGCGWRPLITSLSLVSPFPPSSACLRKPFLVLEHPLCGCAHWADGCHLFNYTGWVTPVKLSLSNCGEGDFITSLPLLSYFLCVY